MVPAVFYDPTKINVSFCKAFRAILDARQMLMNSTAHLAVFHETASSIEEGVGIDGPARGLVAYLHDLGISCHVGDAGRINFTIPLGGVIGLCIVHATHFSACIRETCIYVGRDG